MKLVALLLVFATVLHSSAAAPDAKWLTFIGASGSDRADAIAVDRASNVYITGFISATNVLFGSHVAPVSGGSIMYVAKFNRLGSNIWVRVCGTSNAEGRGVAVDDNDNVYVAGSFYGLSPQTFGTTNLTAHTADSFLVKFNSDGQFQWVRQAWDPNGSIDLATSLTISGTNIYMIGKCRRGVSFGTAVLTNAAIFLALYDFDGNLVDARRLAEPPINNSFAWQVAVDTNGSYYAGLVFDSATISFGGTNANRVGRFADTVFTKWDANGTLLWFKHLQGGQWASCDAVALAPNGDVLVSGRTGGGGSFAGQSVTDAFLARFTSHGDLLWLNNVATNATADGVVTDGSGNSFIVGSLPPGVSLLGGTTITNHSPAWSPYVASFNPSGNLSWALCASATTNHDNYGHSIAIDATGALCLSGFGGTPTITLGTRTATDGHGPYDILLARLAPASPPLSILRASDAVVISWPTNQLGFALECANELSGLWTPLVAPVVRDGLDFTATLPLTNSARFFRLREE